MHLPPSDHFKTASKSGGRQVAAEAVSAFGPVQTMRCVGLPRFRTQIVRDAACLLDVDPSVTSWTCSPTPLFDGELAFQPDFEIVGETAVELGTVDDGAEGIPDWVRAAAAAKGMPLRIIAPPDLECIRLENARELLRYAAWRVTLSDRVRLLAALDTEGSLTLAEAMTAIRNSNDPIGAIAALALRRTRWVTSSDGSPRWRALGTPRSRATSSRRWRKSHAAAVAAACGDAARPRRLSRTGR
ncbi:MULTISPECIES: hypothetical protein [unclassified Aureimonas]|uniref:hypothetical protein n=1 Tax=unclassified Aureimonas TaxID=2615206 RepID=UPI000A63FFF2|nr:MULTISPECIES: hypothetical protein [unclassified Aureimonas]